MAYYQISKILIYQLLASQLTQVVCVIPQFCSGNDQTINIDSHHPLMSGPRPPNRVFDVIKSFSIVFSQNPQIILSIYRVDGACQGFQITSKDISTTQFTIQYQAFQEREINTIYTQYLALVDANIYIGNEVIQQDITGTASFTRQFTVSFPQVPNAILFLNGFNFTYCNRDLNFQISMDQLTQNQYIYKISINYQIEYLAIGVVAGIADYLNGYQSLRSNDEIYLLAQITPIIYAYGFGMTGFVLSSDPFIRYNIDQQIIRPECNITTTTSTWVSENLIQFGYSQFIYKPCGSMQNCGPTHRTTLYDICTPQTVTNCPSNSFTNLQLNECTPCNVKCSTCATNSQNCLVCSNQQLNPPSCNCQNGQYLDANNQCQQCPIWCIQCDLYNCYGCAQNCLNCNLQSCLTCISDNYYISNNQCLQCPNGCATCNKEQCLTCVNPLQLINGTCNYLCTSLCQNCYMGQCLQCIDGYYPTSNTCMKCIINCVTCQNQWQCLSCDQNSMRILNQSNQCICKQGYLELNNICVINNDTETNPEQQFVIPIPNCSQIDTNSAKPQCIKCIYGYLMVNNQCQQCDPSCLSCVQQVNVSSACRFMINSNDNQCLLCESKPGYYSNYQTNQCYTICGDGIVAGQEQCDNDLQNLGCSQCQIDPNFNCFEYECQLNIYPMPTLQQISDVTLIYNSTKVFQLSYQVELQQLNFISVFKIQFGDPSINFTFTSQQLHNNIFIFVIELESNSIGQNISLSFNNVYIKSSQGLVQQIQSVTSQISDYLQVSKNEQINIQNSQTAIETFLIILLMLVSIAVLMGGISIYWNLLDLLQRISYLKYINTIQPYNITQIIQVFGFVQMNNLPMTKYLNIEGYLQQYIDIDQYTSPPLLIANDGFTCITILNIIPIAIVWMISIFIYLFSKLIRRQVLYQQFNESTTFLHYLLKIQRYLIGQINYVCSQWIWSGMIRVQQSTVYDQTFAIVLGFYGINSTLIGDQFFTIILSLLQVMITFVVFNITNFNRQTLSNYKNKFGALIEGVRSVNQSINYNNFIYLNKMIFIVSLVILYDRPIFQISCIVLLQLYQIIILLFDPLENKFEIKKQWVCEISMLIAEFAMLLLVIDDYIDILSYYQRDLVGWLWTSAVIIIIITQLIYDAIQQTMIYQAKYIFVKKAITIIKAILESLFDF